MNTHRVAVTGIGLVTPYGIDRESSWAGMLTGRGCVTWLADVPELGFTPVSGDPVLHIGGVVPASTPVEGRLTGFARLAAAEAVTHANLSRAALVDAACVIGTSKIDMTLFDQQSLCSEESSALRDLLSPAFSAEMVAQDWGCEGGAMSPVAACATGLMSVLRGARLIQHGEAPIVIAGSTDAALHPGLLASYRRLGVHAKPGSNPAGACRPFDQSRQGFAVGEGAACLILEDWDHAVQRGATIYSEWLDGVMASDTSGLTLVNDDGQTLVDVIERLLNRLNLKAEDISAVSLHGTATKLNDKSEAAALRRVFQHACTELPAFGLKGAIGHLMGAAGSVETAASVLALHHQHLPPTCNHHTPDEPVFLQLSTQSQRRELKTILKVSLGFGGHVVAGVLRRTS